MSALARRHARSARLQTAAAASPPPPSLHRRHLRRGQLRSRQLRRLLALAFSSSRPSGLSPSRHRCLLSAFSPSFYHSRLLSISLCIISIAAAAFRSTRRRLLSAVPPSFSCRRFHISGIARASLTSTLQEPARVHIYTNYVLTFVCSVLGIGSARDRRAPGLRLFSIACFCCVITWAHCWRLSVNMYMYMYCRFGLRSASNAGSRSPAICVSRLLTTSQAEI